MRRQLLNIVWPIAALCAAGALLTLTCYKGRTGPDAEPGVVASPEAARHLAEEWALKQARDKRLAKEGRALRVLCMGGSERQGVFLLSRLLPPPEIKQPWERGNRGELLLSRDQGQTWRCSRTGLHNPSAPVYDIVADEARRMLYLATEDGVYRSRDAGATWQRYSRGLPYEGRADIPPSVYRLSLSPRTGQLFCRVPLDGFGVYMTGPDQPAWQDVGQGLPGESITTDISYTPAEDALYSANGSHGVRVIFPLSGKAMGVFRRQRVGALYFWRRDRSFPVHSRRVEPVGELQVDPNSGELWACTYRGLYHRSSGHWRQEGGSSPARTVSFERGHAQRAMLDSIGPLRLRVRGQWTAVEHTPWSKQAMVHGLCFQDGSIYVATNEGLFMGTDAEHWRRVGLPAPSAGDTGS